MFKMMVMGRMLLAQGLRDHTTAGIGRLTDAAARVQEGGIDLLLGNQETTQEEGETCFLDSMNEGILSVRWPLGACP